MAGLFISYARDDDEPFVARLHHDLVQRGIPVWWDRTTMQSRGRTFLQELRDAVDEADRVLLVIGPQAVASDYVSAEWRYALESCRVVVPILRLGKPSLVPGELVTGEDYKLIPDELRAFHCPDFRDGAARSYEDAFEELVRILQAPLPPLAELRGVDALPPHYLARPNALAQLEEQILSDVASPGVAGQGGRVLALHGMAGVGKSVVVAAFARRCRVRRSFGDGVVWLRLGPTPNLVSRQAELGAIFHDDRSHYTEVDAGAARLAAVLERRNCLVVLDDVWQVAHAEPFVNALGAATRCRLLLTTRDRSIAIGLGVPEQTLDILAPEASLALLAAWADEEPAALPAEARTVAQACGFLPLALAIIGAMARGRPDRWRNAVHRLRSADLARLRRDFPNYPYPDLLQAIEVGVDALPNDARARYLELVVFPAREPVPEATLATYFGLDEFDVQDLCDLFVDRSLARRDPSGQLLLHDLQHDYVRGRCGDLRPLHARLVNAYRVRCTDGWETGPDDGYYFDHLAYHLATAGPRERLFELIDRPWMEAQFQRTHSHRAFAADVEQTIEAAESEPVDLVEMIRSTVVYATLGDFSSAAPSGVLAALAGLSESVDEVLGQIALIPDAMRQNEAYLTVARALVQKGRRDVAKQVLLHALAAARTVGESRDAGGVWGRIITGLSQFETGRRLYPGMAESSKAHLLTGIVHELAPLDADAALAIADEVSEPWAQDQLREDLVKSLLAADEMKRAQSVANEVTDADKRAALLGDVAAAYARCGEVDSATELAGKTKELARVVQALGETRRFDEALALLESLEGEIAREARYQLADAIARTGDFQRAYQVAGRDSALADAVSRIMVVLLSHTDQLKLAWESSEFIKDPEQRLITLLDTAESLIKLGKHERALRFVGGALALAREQESPASALSLASGLLREAGDPEQAVAVSREAVSAAAPDNPPVRDAVRGELGSALVAAGHIDEALAIAVGVEDEVTKACVLLAAVHALVAAGRMEEALEAARGITHRRGRSSGLTTVARTFFEQGDRALAESTARDALAAALAIEDEDGRMDAIVQDAGPLAAMVGSEVLSEVYSELVKVGQDVKASAAVGAILAETTHDLETVLAPITGSPRRAFALDVFGLLVRFVPTEADARAVAECALALAGEVGSIEARLEAIAAFVDALRATPRVQSGMRLLGLAWDLLEPDDLDRKDQDLSRPLERVVVLLAEGGQLEPALAFLTMLDEAMQARALARMFALGVEPLGPFAAAVDRLQDPAALTLALAARAEARARTGGPESARKDAERALATAETVAAHPGLLALAGVGPLPTMDHASELAELLRSAADMMRKDRPASDQTSEKTTDEAPDEAHEATVSTPPDVIAEIRMLSFGWAARAHAAAGEPDKVRALAARIEALADHSRESMVGALALIDAARALREVKAEDGARAAAHESIEAMTRIDFDGLRSRVLVRCAPPLLGLIDEPDRKRLVSVAESVATPADRTHALAGLAVAFASKGETACSLKLARRALSTAETIVDRAQRAASMAEAADALSHSGKNDAALATLRRALATARRASRHSVLEVLATGARSLSVLDEGATLSCIGESVLSVERWWRS